MKVSVVIPVYNVEDYVIECLESVAHQESTHSIECVIVDDCGSDKSMELVNRYVADYNGEIDFKVIHRAHNGGLSAARNTGINNATGDYITFVDSDDRLMPGSIDSMASVAIETGLPDLVQGDIAISNPSAQITCFAVSATLFPSYSDCEEWCRYNLLNYVPVTAWAKLIKRSFILENKLFYDEGLIHEDEMWRLRASRKVKSIAFCFKPVYYYFNDNTNSIMHRKDLTGSMAGRIAVAKELVKNFDWTNAKGETKYGVEHMIYYVKGNAWARIENKKLINELLKELEEIAKQSNCPGVLKFMASYLRLPNFIADNVFIRALYRRIIYRMQNRVISSKVK